MIIYNLYFGFIDLPIVPKHIPMHVIRVKFMYKIFVLSIIYGKRSKCPVDFINIFKETYTYVWLVFDMCSVVPFYFNIKYKVYN